MGSFPEHFSADRRASTVDAPVRIIPIAAALVTRADGRTLLVRKRGTRAFMQPGGKIEPGEKPVNALVRELCEELAVVVDPADLRFLGSFRAQAANEPECLVQAEVFAVVINQPVAPAAEIEEILWLELPAPASLHLAPLTREHVLPFLQRS